MRPASRDSSARPSPPQDQSLAEGLRLWSAYPHRIEGPVEMHETHISQIFLAGPFAYKVKKACVTDFLDYGSLPARKAACEKELALNRRYAPDLYLQVVPITLVGDRPRVEGEGQPVEYAVKMHRFADEALLSTQLRHGGLTTAKVHQLAESVAAFHCRAASAAPELGWGTPHRVRDDALANFRDLRHAAQEKDIAESLTRLEQWSDDLFSTHAERFAHRVAQGFIRECHGDLHLENVIQWRGRLVPFDGIEFNEGFRWIDILSDAAFLAMDFAARGRLDLGRSFTNVYLDHTGDYRSLKLWRWYLVYRALVRAKVAALRAGQSGSGDAERTRAIEDCRVHVELARRFTTPEPLRLWITHGLSGSGKTAGSEGVIQRCDAIRLRSDVQRKRLFGLSPTERPSGQRAQEIYSPAAGERTYQRLSELAECILNDGFSVVVDATFLEAAQRKRFSELARQHRAEFAILDFDLPEATLRQRIVERSKRGGDASDATVAVLEKQLATEQPLTAEERPFIVAMPPAGP